MRTLNNKHKVIIIIIIILIVVTGIITFKQQYSKTIKSIVENRVVESSDIYHIATKPSDNIVFLGEPGILFPSVIPSTSYFGLKVYLGPSMPKYAFNL